MDAYLRRRASDPRFRLATADEVPWWQSYAAVEDAPSIVATQPTAKPAANTKTESHPLRKVRHNAMKCWDKFERVPGTRPGAPGSCRRKDSGEKEKESRKSRSRSRSRSSSSSSESDGEGGRRKKAKKEEKKSSE